ncbi:glycosyltransferase family 2 protein [Pedobacter sp. UBA5917]|uniref:glycosyltransferase family 2 protein n=1 Tax=Pedobacter sp. UBA5917 TaxID=1947061 RepID=UPI0025CBAA43|nr:glycosyltransferase family 2 protein [Pedobacter sp. UBA5917]
MKISIITVNLNNLTGLKQTTESVLAQSSKNFEHLIIDGNSTDGSKQYIESISDKLGYWQSKNDLGIYDAMNTGIKHATGEYLIFLNSGDIFYNNDVIKNVMELLVKDIVYGDIEIVDRDKKYVHVTPTVLSFGHFVNNNLPHQSAFIKRELFSTYGLYNPELKICADWTFFLDAVFSYNASYIHIPLTISTFKTDGVSSLAENSQVIAVERNSHLINKYSAFLSDFRTNEPMIAKYKALKNSRMIKILSFFFKQLRF